jgi:uncharacterized protein (TIGR02246 family)
MTINITDNTAGDAYAHDKRAIHELMTNWAAAVKIKDVAALTSMITDDAVFLPPGFPPIRGKQAVERMYRGFFPQFQAIEQTVVLEELEIMGDWAFAWGSEQSILVTQPTGSTIHTEGKGLSILKRQADGSWKISRGINNSLPQPSARAQ